MNNLLAIISHPKDNQLVQRHWSSFKMLGWDILGAGTIGGECVWPEKVHRIDTGIIGKKRVACGTAIWGLLQIELDIWKWFLDHEEYDSVCVIEADNYFCRRPPDHPGGGLYLITLLPNFDRAGLFKTSWYASTPRWADRKCAEKLHDHGKRMYEQGHVEHFISDRFPALICERAHIPWLSQPAWSPSPFAWGGSYDEVWLRDSRAAIAMGAYCLHSVKTEWQLKAVEVAMLEYDLSLP